MAKSFAGYRSQQVAGMFPVVAQWVVGK